MPSFGICVWHYMTLQKHRHYNGNVTFVCAKEWHRHKNKHHLPLEVQLCQYVVGDFSTYGLLLDELLTSLYNNWTRKTYIKNKIVTCIISDHSIKTIKLSNNWKQKSPSRDMVRYMAMSSQRLQKHVNTTICR